MTTLKEKAYGVTQLCHGTTGTSDNEISQELSCKTGERKNREEKKRVWLTHWEVSNNCTDEFLLANLTFFNFTLKVSDTKISALTYRTAIVQRTCFYFRI